MKRLRTASINNRSTGNEGMTLGVQFVPVKKLVERIARLGVEDHVERISDAKAKLTNLGNALAGRSGHLSIEFCLGHGKVPF